MSGLHWGLAGSVGTQGPEGYRCHKGTLGATRGCRGVKAALGAGRKCRYSGARRGIGGIREHGGSYKM